MPRLEAFVSHVTVESKFADLLRARLTHDFIGLVNLFVSSDATSIPVGSRWFEGILAALNRADLQLIICSAESIRRPWIHYEAGAARIRGVEVIPLCHSGATPEQLPVPLSMSEGALLTEAGGLQKLYSRLSGMLGSAVPRVDFEALARQFKVLEAEYEGLRKNDRAATAGANDESIVANPSVLCVSSRQYLELGFENQLQTVLDAFPKDLRHNRVITSDGLRAALSGRESVEVVHIATYVCPRSGVLHFGHVELPSGRADPEQRDFLSASELATLFKHARTRLVVIGSGDSLALATMLLPVTNVIAPNDIVSAQAMAVWVRTFYGQLRDRSLADACELAAVVSRAPMRLLTEQRPSSLFIRLPEPTGSDSGVAVSHLLNPESGNQLQAADGES